jgi:predicted amidophosphoribosyltransferase
VVPTTCPQCGSSFLQPLRCEARAQDSVSVELRCGECGRWVTEACTRAEVRALDQRQAEWREIILAGYERSVAETMDALAKCLGVALALDLIGADDFAPRVSRRPRPATR